MLQQAVLSFQFTSTVSA